MKRIFIFAICMATMVHAAIAACVQSGKKYTSCAAGYYLSGGVCTRCPAIGNTYGTTSANNTGDITSCSIAGNTQWGEDSRGFYTYEGDCHYSN